MARRTSTSTALTSIRSLGLRYSRQPLRAAGIGCTCSAKVRALLAGEKPTLRECQPARGLGEAAPAAGSLVFSRRSRNGCKENSQCGEDLIMQRVLYGTLCGDELQTIGGPGGQRGSLSPDRTWSSRRWGHWPGLGALVATNGLARRG